MHPKVHQNMHRMHEYERICKDALQNCLSKASLYDNTNRILKLWNKQTFFIGLKDSPHFSEENGTNLTENHSKRFLSYKRNKKQIA